MEEVVNVNEMRVAKARKLGNVVGPARGRMSMRRAENLITYKSICIYTSGIVLVGAQHERVRDKGMKENWNMTQ